MRSIDERTAELERGQRWPELVELLESSASAAGDAPLRVELLLRLADVQRQHCRNQTGAVRALEAALAVDPGDARVVDQLARVYEERKDWKKLVNLRAGAIDAADDPGERLSRALEVAHLAGRLPARADAIEAWRRVLEMAPACVEAMAALEDLYTREKQWEAVADVCARHAEVAFSVEERAGALRKLGLLFANKLEDPRRSIAAWRALLELAPDDEEALRALRRLLVDVGAWDELEESYAVRGKLDEFARFLEHRAPKHEPAEQVGLWCRLGEIYRDHLDDPRRAVRAFERAFELAPDDLRAATALAALHSRDQSPREFVAAMAVARRALDPREQLEQTRVLAEISEHRLREPAAALGFWLEVLDSEWRDPDVRAHVERLAAATGEWERMVAAYAAVCERSEEAPGEQTLLPLLAEIAHVQETRLGQSERALETFQRILDRYGSQGAALDALERLYLAQGRYAEALGVHERQLEQAEDQDERHRVLRKMARLGEEKLGDDRAAAAAYRVILDDVGYDEEALAALDRVCTRLGEWEPLAAALEGALPHAADADAGRLRYRLGEVCERLGDAARAVACYADALASADSREAARAALERLYRSEAHRPVAAQALAPLYEAENRHAQLADALEAIADAEADGVRRAALLRRVGELCERELAAPDRAFEAYARALIEDPGDREVPERLEAVARASGGWAALAEAYRTVFARPLELSHQVELRLRLGRIYARELGDPARAVRAFRRALDLRPTSAAAVLALDAVLAGAHRFDELAELLAAAPVGGGGDGDGGGGDRAPAPPLRGADLRPGAAPAGDDALLAALRARLDRAPDDARARLALVRVRAARGDAAGAAQVCLAGAGRARAAGDEALAAEWRERAAQLDARHAAVPRPGADDAEPRPDPAAARRLAGWSAAGQWKKVLEVRLGMAEAEAEPARRGQHYFEAGVTCRDRLKKPLQALRWFEAALDCFLDEGGPPVVEATVRAIQAIEAIHAASGDWKALEQSYRRMIERLQRRSHARLLESMIWQSLGDVYRVRLGDPEAATRAFEQAIAAQQRLPSEAGLEAAVDDEERI